MGMTSLRPLGLQRQLVTDHRSHWEHSSPGTSRSAAAHLTCPLVQGHLARGSQVALGGQGDITASPTSQAQGSHETHGQHVKYPKYKSNSKAGISPLPRTAQMKLMVVLLPPTALRKVTPARHSLTAWLSHPPLPFPWTRWHQGEL